MNIRQKIKDAQDIKNEVVDIPEWDVKVEIQTMTAKQRAELLTASVGEDGKFIQKNFQAGLIIACCYDPETKEKIFSPNDAEWLMEKSAGPIENLASKISRISGLSKLAMEETEKN